LPLSILITRTTFAIAANPCACPRYEDLVCDPVGTAHSLASFLGVPFSEGMAAPHTSGRTTQTASNEQVRRPVYTSSVGRWRLFDVGADSAGAGPEAGVGAGAGNLEALGVALGGFPAAAVLERVLSFEPRPSDPAALRDLARGLPCAPAPGAPSARSPSTPDRQAPPSDGLAGKEARWPVGEPIRRL
jgi:hypothetical protein